MFSETFKDLAKPQWLAALGVLIARDGTTIRELAEMLDVSYMAAKQYSEDLTRLGYLQRMRTPRTAVGRPEISYRVTPKTNRLFPDIGMSLCLELLENSRILFGENAPERLIYQHFESLHARWSKILTPLGDPREKAAELASLRCRYGAVCIFSTLPGSPARLIDTHNPLDPVFQHYPKAVSMETRLLQDLIGTNVERRTSHPGGRVEFILPGIRNPETD